MLSYDVWLVQHLKVSIFYLKGWYDLLHVKMHSPAWFCIWLFCLCYFPVYNIFVTNGKVISQENKWHFIVCMFAIVCSWLWIGWIEQFWWPTSVLVLEGQSSWGAIRIDWSHIEIEICWYNSTDYICFFYAEYFD